MLQPILQREFGKRNIEAISLPEYFTTALNPNIKLRPYQEECFRYFLSYWENEFKEKDARTHLLFHMATGSGKTLIMAGVMLYLFEQGYRSFLFFVNSTNVIEKTKDNFLNPNSSKYLFGQQIKIGKKKVEIKLVDNFQSVDENCINLCLTTIQGLHHSLNEPRENGVTYDDFSEKRVVLISDEAHHINAATKRGKKEKELFVQRELFSQKVVSDIVDWETTVDLIFRSNVNNVLLEFTATADLLNGNIAEKYKNKVIFDYPLKRFREDGYSKDISLVQSDLPPIDRAIQCVLLSQYKRKLFERIGQNIKPVMMLKSKTIKDNGNFYKDFIAAINSFSEEKLISIYRGATGDLKDVFTFLKEENITLENFIQEIKEDFSEEKLLLVDGNEISPIKQRLLNSLEDKNNEIRVIFAVDMLNEGWDVLNLFDIVRMYNTRDGKDGQAGPTTMREAQLIGRGARYMPFVLKGGDNKFIAKSANGDNDYSEEVERGIRKFDNDISNRLRMLETMHYHSAHNPKYISELTSAMIRTGIVAEKVKEVELKLKDSFKQSALYKDGYILLNSRVRYESNAQNLGFCKEILEKNYKVHLLTGGIVIGALDGAVDGEFLQESSKQFGLLDMGSHVVRAAINRLESYSFSNLKEIYKNLHSIKEFIESPVYLGGITVSVYSSKDRLENLSQSDKLHVVIDVLRQIEPSLSHELIGFRGSKEFIPHLIQETFKDYKQKISLDSSDDKEYGQSMLESNNSELRMDLSQTEWHAYNDCYGTSEEKYLIRYVESIYPRMKEQYDEIYLVRNERHFKLYSFETGDAYQPDYVLFMKKKNENAKTDAIQIFIEPKGEHLRQTDKWKEDQLVSIRQKADVQWSTQSSDYDVWGVPFFTEKYITKFADVLCRELNL